MRDDLVSDITKKMKVFGFKYSEKEKLERFINKNRMNRMSKQATNQNLISIT